VVLAQPRQIRSDGGDRQGSGCQRSGFRLAAAEGVGVGRRRAVAFEVRDGCPSPTGHPGAGRRLILDGRQARRGAHVLAHAAVEACRRGAGKRRRSISVGRRRGLAPVRRRGVRTGCAGRLPRVAPRSRPFRAGTPPSAPAHPCSETDASVTRGSTRNRISESHRDGAHRVR
jgi:hypothetical protein